MHKWPQTLKLLLLSGNAQANHVLSPYTFTNSTGIQQTGTIPSKGAATYTPSTGTQTINANQYLSGIQTINNLGGTAVASQVLSTASFSSNNAGRAVQGTIPSKTAATYTPSTSQQVITAGQFLSGAQTIAPIPSSYVNINNQQMVFNYGSYGPLASLGAYTATYTTAGGIVADSSSPATQTNVGGMRIEAATGKVFRAAFPALWKYMRVSWGMATSASGYVRFWAISASTRKSLGYFESSVSTSGASGTYERPLDFSNYVTEDWFLYIYTSVSMANYGIFKIALGPSAIASF